MQALSKQFFLLSFLPAFGYWYLEANYPITIAVVGGIGLAILELLLEKVFTKSTHALSRFNFFLVCVLGLIAIIGQEGIWFKLQPAIGSIVMGVFLGVKLYRGEGMMLELLHSMGKSGHPKIFNKLERDLVIFLILYGVVMIFVALYYSTNVWITMKTAGIYLGFFPFFLFEVFLTRKRAKEIALDKN